MTAADRDREAFEAAMDEYSAVLKAGGYGFSEADFLAGWKACSAHARAQAGEPVAAGAWTREDLAAGLAELDGIDLVPPLKSVVDLEYLNRADDLLTFLSVASAANEPLGAIHPAPAQEPVEVPAGCDDPESARARVAYVSEQEGLNGAAAFWRPCTGCHETNEGYSAGFPRSKVFGCEVGSGCRECGGLGAIWEHYSEADLKALAEECAAPVSPPAESEGNKNGE